MDRALCNNKRGKHAQDIAKEIGKTGHGVSMLKMFIDVSNSSVVIYENSGELTKLLKGQTKTDAYRVVQWFRSRMYSVKHWSDLASTHGSVPERERFWLVAVKPDIADEDD